MEQIIEWIKAQKILEAIILLKKQLNALNRSQLQEIFDCAVKCRCPPIVDHLFSCEKFIDCERSFISAFWAQLSGNFHISPQNLVLSKYFNPNKMPYDSNIYCTWFMILAYENMHQCLELCIAAGFSLETNTDTELEHVERAISETMIGGRKTASGALLTQFKNDPHAIRRKLHKTWFPGVQDACNAFILVLLISENLFAIVQ